LGFGSHHLLWLQKGSFRSGHSTFWKINCLHWYIFLAYFNLSSGESCKSPSPCGLMWFPVNIWNPALYSTLVRRIGQCSDYAVTWYYWCAGNPSVWSRFNRCCCICWQWSLDRDSAVFQREQICMLTVLYVNLLSPSPVAIHLLLPLFCAGS
jgi:hypothetical protein